MNQVCIKKVGDENDLPLPKYSTQGSAGLDLMSRICCTIEPGQHKAVPTGIAISLPQGLEAQIRPRSGLALSHGITVLNAPGTIDSDYRGEVKVILINHGDFDFEIIPGMRIAQMVISKYVQVELVEVDNLDETERGEKGFGSTGV